jgi:hypothetical protein
MALGQIPHDIEAECTSKHEEESKYVLEQVSLPLKYNRQ